MTAFALRGEYIKPRCACNVHLCIFVDACASRADYSFVQRRRDRGSVGWRVGAVCAPKSTTTRPRPPLRPLDTQWRRSRTHPQHPQASPHRQRHACRRHAAARLLGGRCRRRFTRPDEPRRPRERAPVRQRARGAAEQAVEGGAAAHARRCARGGARLRAEPPRARLAAVARQDGPARPRRQARRARQDPRAEGDRLPAGHREAAGGPRP
mmetsp:Transcript_23469/g.54294  ORF Transcript_23469/g.54294 Transcript_23469/m.54294 type:complete len:210 (+) Transcript_23469:387-1016(+)